MNIKSKRGYAVLDTNVDLRIDRVDSLVSPNELARELPLSDELTARILKDRKRVDDVICGRDRRLLAIVGPCSIHDPAAALEYADRLHDLSKRVSDQLLIVMRTYFEKPRTIGGWKGLIIDPAMDGSYDIGEGLRQARRLLIQITEKGLPVGTEMLDPIVPQYIDETISWCAIGARTTESQVHRTLSSGMSVPVGFKNSTSGEVSHALNAIKSASSGGAFIGIDKDGNSAIYRTTGNTSGHLILRGGDTGPNYYEEEVEDAVKSMKALEINPSIIVDCSHANSRKDFTRQRRVLRSVIDQVLMGRKELRGFMIESNLFEGCQQIGEDLSTLRYGVSVTDPCIGWDETESILLKAAYLLQNAEREGGKL